MISLFVGCVFVVVGLLGLAYWLQDFLVAVRGLAPISLIFGGIVAIVSGVSSLRPRRIDEQKK